MQVEPTKKGILLWGPPGCGKSSSKTEMEKKYGKTFLFINVDALVEYIICHYFTKESTLNFNKKHATKIQQEFYWKIRGIKLSELIGSDEKVIEAFLSNILRDVHEVDVNWLIVRNHLVQLRRRYDNLGEQTVTSLYEDLIVGYAKHSQKYNLMIETTGKAFDAKWAAQVFRGTKSQLRVVYIDDVDELIQRLSKRTNQMINAAPEQVRKLYVQSYGQSLLQAIQSNVFDIIDVVDNSAASAIKLLELTRGDDRYYISVLLSDDEVHQKSTREFIAKIKLNIGMPGQIKMGDYYCIRSCAWCSDGSTMIGGLHRLLEKLDKMV